MKSGNYFRNYGHKIGDMGCIDSDKSNPVYLVGSYYKKPGWNYLNQIRSVWIHIRIERILIVEFHFTNNHKQKTKKQTTNKKKRKKPSLY